MCGIAGIWNYSGDVPAELRLQSMLRAMRHRGPDGQGSHRFAGGACGMVRLALVDLSPRGDQPMWSECGRIAVVFNGEIYNFREERRRLESKGYSFRSTTDTEVLLALYREYGPECVNYLRGMYCAAFFDWRDSDLDHAPIVTLLRGPLGIKPLFVCEIGASEKTTLVFASELRAILASGLVTPRISQEGLNDYLRYGRILQPRTILEGVRMLGPGTYERFAPGRSPERKRFWSMPPYAPKQESFDESAERLRDVLEESVRLHALADAPMGVFLSGGIDSTAIATLMRPHVSRLNSYTFQFPDLPFPDESKEAAATAARLDCEHHVVTVTGKDAADLMPLFAEQIDQPSVDGLNTWFLSRAAARDVKGILSGVGGDELFAGYAVTGRLLNTSQTLGGHLYSLIGRAVHAVDAIVPITRLHPRLEAAASYRSLSALWSFPHQVFEPREVDALTAGRYSTDTSPSEEDRLRAVLQFAVGRDWSGETPIGMSCLLDSYVFMMCQLLRDSDVTGMASSLELRVPFVDLKLVEFSRSCFDEYKLTTDDVRNKRSKRVLIHALRDVMPTDALTRFKRGFNVPNDLWMRRHLGPLIDDTCSESSVRKRGWFDPRYVQRLVRTRRSSTTRAMYPQVWVLMIAELWARSVLDQPPPSFGKVSTLTTATTSRNAVQMQTPGVTET
jgi:asparagine synthase (glutamine-hydrolysing)